MGVDHACCMAHGLHARLHTGGSPVWHRASVPCGDYCMRVHDMQPVFTADACLTTGEACPQHSMHNLDRSDQGLPGHGTHQSPSQTHCARLAEVPPLGGPDAGQPEKLPAQPQRPVSRSRV